MYLTGVCFSAILSIFVFAILAFPFASYPFRWQKENIFLYADIFFIERGTW